MEVNRTRSNNLFAIITFIFFLFFVIWSYASNGFTDWIIYFSGIRDIKVLTIFSSIHLILTIIVLIQILIVSQNIRERGIKIMAAFIMICLITFAVLNLLLSILTFLGSFV